MFQDNSVSSLMKVQDFLMSEFCKSSKKVNCGYGIGFAYSCNEALAPSIDTDL